MPRSFPGASINKGGKGQHPTPRLGSRMLQLLSANLALNFPKSLEKYYLKQRVETCIDRVKAGLFLGLMLVGLFGLLDYLYQPEQAGDLWRIRVSLLAVLAAIFALTFSSSMRFFYDFAVVSAGVGLMVGHCGFALLSPEPIKWVYYLSALPIVLWWSKLAHITVRWAWISVLINLMLVNFVWFQLDTIAVDVIVYLNVLLAVLAVATVYSISMQQVAMRGQYLEQHKQNLMKFDRDLLEDSETRLRFLVVLDSLTGLANKRSFERVLKQEWNRMARNRQPIGMLRLNIDQYDSLKAQGGAEAVENAFVSVAESIRGFTRRSGDVAAHFNNGKFALMLPSTDLNASYQVATMLKEGINGLGIRVAPESAEQLTVSIGLTAMVPRPQFMHTEILGIAEEALRRAQCLGEGQVICL